MTVWNFACPDDGGNYDLEIGPSEGLDLAFQRALAVDHTDGTNGAATMQTQPFDPNLATLKGTLLEESQYVAMLTWWQKTRRVRITDRIGRIFTVLIVEYDPQRVHVASHPWKHEWTMTVDVLQAILPAIGDSNPVVVPGGYLTWANSEGTWDDHDETWEEATA